MYLHLTRRSAACPSAALHPLYIDHPEQAGAYEHKDTYAFCAGLLVAPITAPQHNVTLLASKTLWLPPGQWLDMISGTAAGVSSADSSSGTAVTLGFTLWEVPTFAQAGTMLPVAPPTVGSSGFGAKTDAHPALGAAATKPALRTWEVYGASPPS